MEKNKKYKGNYTYGNVAYELQPEIGEVKKKKTAIKSKRNVYAKLKLVASVGIMAVMALLILTRFASTVKLTYSIRAVKSDISKVQQNNDDLRVSIARTNNIKNIEQVAIKSYGMIEPQNNQFVYIDVKPLTSSVESTAKVQSASGDKLLQKIIGLIH